MNAPVLNKMHRLAVQICQSHLLFLIQSTAPRHGYIKRASAYFYALTIPELQQRLIINGGNHVHLIPEGTEILVRFLQSALEINNLNRKMSVLPIGLGKIFHQHMSRRQRRRSDADYHILRIGPHPLPAAPLRQTPS